MRQEINYKGHVLSLEYTGDIPQKQLDLRFERMKKAIDKKRRYYYIQLNFKPYKPGTRAVWPLLFESYEQAWEYANKHWKHIASPYNQHKFVSCSVETTKLINPLPDRKIIPRGLELRGTHSTVLERKID